MVAVGWNYNLLKLLSCFFIYQNQLKFSYDNVQIFYRQTFLLQRQEFMFEKVFMKIKEYGWTFYVKSG